MTSRRLGFGHTGWFAKQLAKPGVRLAFEEDRASFEFGAQLTECLKQKGITRTELARRLGKSKPYVTQVLRDGRNLTIQTMTELADAVGFELHVRLVEQDHEGGPIYVDPGTNWFSMLKTTTMTMEYEYVRAKCSMHVEWDPGSGGPDEIEKRSNWVEGVDQDSEGPPPSVNWLEG